MRAHVGARAGEGIVEVRDAQALVVARAQRSELVIAVRFARPAMAWRVDRLADDAAQLLARARFDLPVEQVVVDVVVLAAASLPDRGVVVLPYMEDVVPRHGVGERLGGARGVDAAARAERIL